MDGCMDGWMDVPLCDVIVQVWQNEVMSGPCQGAQGDTDHHGPSKCLCVTLVLTALHKMFYAVKTVAKKQRLSQRQQVSHPRHLRTSQLQTPHPRRSQQRRQ